MFVIVDPLGEEVADVGGEGSGCSTGAK